MLQLLSAIFGFAAPFLPELVKLFRERQDNKHELAMMELRMKQGAAEHNWKMEEINAQADIAEAQAIRQPQQSFGVQLIDAARDSNFGKWALVPAFYLFTLLDFISGLVRPTITYAMVVYYMMVKWAMFLQAKTSTGTWQAAVKEVWTDNDWAVLVMVLSYWFGSRVAKAAFGGSASTIKAGA